MNLRNIALILQFYALICQPQISYCMKKSPTALDQKMNVIIDSKAATENKIKEKKVLIGKLQNYLIEINKYMGFLLRCINGENYLDAQMINTIIMKLNNIREELDISGKFTLSDNLKTQIRAENELVNNLNGKFNVKPNNKIISIINQYKRSEKELNALFLADLIAEKTKFYNTDLNKLGLLQITIYQHDALESLLGQINNELHVITENPNLINQADKSQINYLELKNKLVKDKLELESTKMALISTAADLQRATDELVRIEFDLKGQNKSEDKFKATQINGDLNREITKIHSTNNIEDLVRDNQAAFNSSKYNERLVEAWLSNNIEKIKDILTERLICNSEMLQERSKTDLPKGPSLSDKKAKEAEIANLRNTIDKLEKKIELLRKEIDAAEKILKGKNNLEEEIRSVLSKSGRGPVNFVSTETVSESQAPKSWANDINQGKFIPRPDREEGKSEDKNADYPSSEYIKNRFAKLRDNERPINANNLSLQEMLLQSRLSRKRANTSSSNDKSNNSNIKANTISSSSSSSSTQEKTKSYADFVFERQTKEAIEASKAPSNSAITSSNAIKKNSSSSSSSSSGDLIKDTSKQASVSSQASRNSSSSSSTKLNPTGETDFAMATRLDFLEKQRAIAASKKVVYRPQKGITIRNNNNINKTTDATKSASSSADVGQEKSQNKTAITATPITTTTSATSNFLSGNRIGIIMPGEDPAPDYEDEASAVLDSRNKRTDTTNVNKNINISNVQRTNEERRRILTDFTLGLHAKAAYIKRKSLGISSLSSSESSLSSKKIFKNLDLKHFESHIKPNNLNK